MLHFKKGMMVLDQDEQTSMQDGLKRAQRHLVFLDEVVGEEQKQGKRVRRLVRGMMVMKPQK